jgi:aminoglycoside phosphotransferase (APT) family kinase protein
MGVDGLDRVALDLGDVLAAAVDDVVPFGDGHSGFTYRVRVRAGATAVHRILRLSPPGARIVGPSDVGLQGRVMQAAGRSGVPVPAVVACSSAPRVDGRAFVLMQQVPGCRWDEQDELDDAAVLRAAVDVLDTLRAVPPGDSGLDPAGARDAAAEIDHWSRLLPRCAPELRQPLERAAAALRACAPATPSVHLVHGDYHFGNLLFDRARIAAVLDWEVAGLGDPLFDVAGLAVAALRSTFAPDPNPTGNVRVGRADVARAAGVDADLFDWYVAATCFKYAAILGYNDRLHRLGKRVDPIYDALAATMRGLTAESLRLPHPEGLPT